MNVKWKWQGDNSKMRVAMRQVDAVFLQTNVRRMNLARKIAPQSVMQAQQGAYFWKMISRPNWKVFEW